MLSAIFLTYIILSLWSRLNLIVPSYLTFLIRASHFFLVLALVCIFGIPLALLISKTSYRYNAFHYLSRIFSFLLSYLVGVYVHYDGYDIDANDEQAIYVVNHQSSFDMLVMGRIVPRRCSVLAKKDLSKAPIFGQCLRVAHTIFIDRKNHESAMKTMRESSEKIMREKLSLLVFPEGTRSRQKDRTLLPFKKGAFHLAVQAQIPLIPVVISSYEDIYDSKQCFNSGVIQARVLNPIHTKGLTADDIDALVENTRNLMSETFKAISPPLKLHDS